MFRSMRALSTAAFVAAMLTACAPSEPNDPYARDFDNARSVATSDFEQTVLADDEITRQEYVEANERWLLCMEDTYPPDSGKIVSLKLGEDGLYQYVAIGFSPGDEDIYDATSDACAVGTTQYINALFSATSVNPKNEQWSALVVECLIRGGTVGDDYSEQNLLADMAKGSSGVVTEEYDAATGITTRTTAAPEFDADEATLLDMDSEAVQLCLVNPNP